MIAAKKVGMKVGAVVAAAVSLVAIRVEASSFDRWLRNPYPVASGFSFPVGDGEGGGAYTDRGRAPLRGLVRRDAPG